MEIYSQEIQEEKDILAARDRARVICEELGFGVTQQLQVTTAVFELVKNILEHGGGGSIAFSLQTEGDTFTLEVEGRDHGPGMTEEQQQELLESGAASSTALRGIAAMKRLMDKIDIESEPGLGTTIRLTKKKSQSPKTLARNFVSFLQEKFSARKNPTLSEELRMQNLNLVQSLSLYEEKNQELAKKNKELLDLKKLMETSNQELHDRSAELQEALLSLGDRTTELEAQNRRFAAVLQQMSEGVMITDRSGTVTTANEQVCRFFSVKEEEVVGLSKTAWMQWLSRFRAFPEETWNKTLAAWADHPKQSYTLPLRVGEEGQGRQYHCRTFPILDSEEKIIGRLWIIEPDGEN